MGITDKIKGAASKVRGTVGKAVDKATGKKQQLVNSFYKKSAQAQAKLNSIDPEDIAKGEKIKEMFGRSGILGTLMEESNKLYLLSNFKKLFDPVDKYYRTVKIEALADKATKILLDMGKKDIMGSNLSVALKPFIGKNYEKTLKELPDIVKNNVKFKKASAKIKIIAISSMAAGIATLPVACITAPMAATAAGMIAIGLIPDVILLSGFLTTEIAFTPSNKEFQAHEVLKKLKSDLKRLRKTLEAIGKYEKKFEVLDKFGDTFENFMEKANEAAIAYLNKKASSSNEHNISDVVKAEFCAKIQGAYGLYESDLKKAKQNN